MVHQLYAKMRELQEQIRRIQEEDRILEGVDIALYAVFEEWNMFEGYDPVGYLECYAKKMKLQGVPEDRMVASFQQLVAPELCERVQELAKDYEDSWDDFEVAIKQEYLDYVDLEMMHIPSKELDDDKEDAGSLEQIQVPSNVIPRNQVRAKLEAIINECLLQDGSLLQAKDEDIIKAVYEKLDSPASFHGACAFGATMACEPKGEESVSEMVCDKRAKSNLCGNANEGACNEVIFLQGNMSLGCPRVCKKYLGDTNDSLRVCKLYPRDKEDSLQVCKLYPRDKEGENISPEGNSRHMCEHSPTTDWKGAYVEDLKQNIIDECLLQDKALLYAEEEDILKVFYANLGISYVENELEEPCANHEENNLEPGSQAESLCLDSHCDDEFSDADVIVSASPNVCLDHVDEFNGLNDLLDSEASDSLDDSEREGLTADNGPVVPYECVQVVMPLEMDSQVLVSEEASKVTSHGLFETDEVNVGCIHVDMAIHGSHHGELHVNNGLDEIDSELDAILDDALGDFMKYGMYPSTLDSSRIKVDQFPDASEDVQVLCKPNDCEVIDPELDAILDDALSDFLCVGGVDALHSLQGAKEEGYDSTGKVNECLMVGKPCVGNMDFDKMLPYVWSKLLMQMLFGIAIQYAVQEQQTWQEANFAEFFFEEQGSLNEGDNHVYAGNRSEGWAAYEQELCHAYRKQLGFDPGGLEWCLFILDWDSSLWPFDPGGEFNAHEYMQLYGRVIYMLYDLLRPYMQSEEAGEDVVFDREFLCSINTIVAHTGGCAGLEGVDVVPWHIYSGKTCE